jgi:hypothetical protein
VIISRWKKILSFIFVMLVVCSIIVKPAYTQNSQCIHGMRIVGKKSIYLSHMPLFNSQCHSYQAILEVVFTGDANPQEKYLLDRAKSPIQNEYTIEPIEHFLLPTIASGKVKSFKANIHRGQYERNSEPQLVASNITVEIKSVAYFQKLDGKANSHDSKFMQYLLFGDINDKYLSHLITNPPDFDQILSSKVSLNSSDNISTLRAVKLVMPGRKIMKSSKLKQALKPHDEVISLINGKGNPIKIKVGEEYFLETDDLKN